jgi:hypothetical protein
MNAKTQPTMRPIIDPTCTSLVGLTQPSATCMLLIVQDSHRLKRHGVGGSTPSLATISFNGLADQPEISHL